MAKPIKSTKSAKSSASLRLKPVGAKLPDDFKTHFFLASDYFHDSFITDIRFDQKQNSLTVTLAAEREGASFRTRNNPQFQYRLAFFGCKHVELAHSSLPAEFFSAEFKSSARLREVDQLHGKKHYHLRILTRECFVHQAYMDFVFRRAEVRRVRGRTNVPKDFRGWTPIPEWPKHWEGMSAKDLRAKERSKWDFERAWAMRLRSSRGDRTVLKRAVENLRKPERDLFVSAARTLGELGAVRHVAALARALRRNLQTDVQREVLDALELIAWRSSADRLPGEKLSVHRSAMKRPVRRAK